MFIKDKKQIPTSKMAMPIYCNILNKSMCYKFGDCVTVYF
jgi:hypothetical protein